MDAYLYQAALYCSDCGEAIRKSLNRAHKKPAREYDEWTYDSDNYPKGPYGDGGGEADCPQHCDDCGVFLENPLTADGLEYVRAAVAEAYDAGNPDCVAMTEWREFYDIETPSDDDDDTEEE